MTGTGPDVAADDAAERLRRRYPRARVPRPVLVALVGLLAVIGLTWVIWTATVRSQPPVAARVSTFTAPSTERMVVIVTVDRRDPAQPVVCRVLAQDADRLPVGEQVVRVPPGADRLVDVEVRLTTLRRGVAASVRDCAVV